MGKPIKMLEFIFIIVFPWQDISDIHKKAPKF